MSTSRPQRASAARSVQYAEEDSDQSCEEDITSVVPRDDKRRRKTNNMESSLKTDFKTTRQRRPSATRSVQYAEEDSDQSFDEEITSVVVSQDDDKRRHRSNTIDSVLKADSQETSVKSIPGTTETKHSQLAKYGFFKVAKQTKTDDDDEADTRTKERVKTPKAKQATKQVSKRRKEDSSSDSRNLSRSNAKKSYVEAESDDEFDNSLMYNDDSDENSCDSNSKSSNNSDSFQYSIQYILGSKSLSSSEWREICADMNTLEVTRGSVWQQPDDEYHSNSPTPIEKFLIKWIHASFLHVSWETEIDLITILGAKAKNQLKRFRLQNVVALSSQEHELFDDLKRGEYFLPSFIRIERILDVDDKNVSMQDIDFASAILPPCEPSSSPNPASLSAAHDIVLDDSGTKKVLPVEEEHDKNDIDKVVEKADSLSRKSNRIKRTISRTKNKGASNENDTPKKIISKANLLHSNECWVTVKWEGLPYTFCTFESIQDIRNRGVEYESSMRSFFMREQREPSHKSRPVVYTRKLVEECALSKPPGYLNDRLRDYQWEGVRWLLYNWSQRRNSILADEMGLGKTIQSVTFLQMLKSYQNLTGPFLIIAPLSTIVNWQREIMMWTDMDAVVYHGSQEDRNLIREHDFFYMSRKKSDGYKLEIVVTTPETSMAIDFKAGSGRNLRELSKIEWDLLIVDEAHKLKNHSSKFCRVLREEYSFRNSLLLTGTPLQNSTLELWTLLNFVDPKQFPDAPSFTEEFGQLSNVTQLEKLHKNLKPYLLRREKENVEKTVPPKEEIIIEVELTVPQKQYYRAIYEQNTSFLYRGEAKDGPRLSNLAIELRKCCNHPFLVKGAEFELYKRNENDASYLDLLVKTSGKMVLLDKLLPKLKNDGHRVLIFSQFRIMLDIIEDYLILKRLSYERVDGAVTGKDRQGAIDRYTAETSSTFVMLLSTRAGGVGINLTSADTVIIYDSDWNPQNDLQAQARAHRIGQTKNVKVYRLLAKKSYEMQMFHAASLKLGLDYAIMRGSNDSENKVKVEKRGRRKVSEDEQTASINRTSSSMSKTELENLLKHGAYDIFREERNGISEIESRNFCDADIEQILNHSAVVVHDGTESSLMRTASNSFSTASFVSSEGRENDVDINDPDFWSKVVVIGSSDEVVEGGSRRKCRNAITEGMYKEPGMTFKAVTNDSSDDSDSISSQNDKLAGKKRSRSSKPTHEEADFSDQNKMTKLLNAMQVKGYGNWDAVQLDSKLKWTKEDIALGSRYLVLQQLIQSSYNEDYYNRRQSWDSVVPPESLSPGDISLITADEKKCAGEINALGVFDRLRHSKVARLALSAIMTHKKIDAESMFGRTNLAFFDSTQIEMEILHSSVTQIFFKEIDSESLGTDSSFNPIVSFKKPIAAWTTDFFDTDGFAAAHSKSTEILSLIKEICPTDLFRLNNLSPIQPNIENNPDNENSSAFLLKAVKSLKNKAVEKLSLLDDMLEVQLAVLVAEGKLKVPELSKSESESKSFGSEGEDVSPIIETEVLNYFSHYIERAIECDESLDQSLTGLSISTSWNTICDALLLTAVNKFGFPDNRKRYVNIQEFMTLYFSPAVCTSSDQISAEMNQSPDGHDISGQISVSVIEDRFPGGFPQREKLCKRVKDLIFLIKNGLSASPESSKKLSLNVLKTLSKFGCPRIVDEFIGSDTNVSDHNYRIEYIFGWDRFTQECGVKLVSCQWVDRIKARISTLSKHAVRGGDKLKNNVVVSLPYFDEVPMKTLVDCFQFIEVMDRVRLALVLLGNDQLKELLLNARVPLAGVAQFSGDRANPSSNLSNNKDRDLSMPIWWTLEHDINLMKAVVQYGYNSWKVLSSTQLTSSTALVNICYVELSTVPTDFELPARESSADEYILHLTPKCCEKRFQLLSKNFHVSRWLSRQHSVGKHLSIPLVSFAPLLFNTSSVRILPKSENSHDSSVTGSNVSNICSIFAKRSSKQHGTVEVVEKQGVAAEAKSDKPNEDCSGQQLSTQECVDDLAERQNITGREVTENQETQSIVGEGVQSETKNGVDEIPAQNDSTLSIDSVHNFSSKQDDNLEDSQHTKNAISDVIVLNVDKTTGTKRIYLAEDVNLPATEISHEESGTESKREESAIAVDSIEEENICKDNNTNEKEIHNKENKAVQAKSAKASQVKSSIPNLFNYFSKKQKN